MSITRSLLISILTIFISNPAISQQVNALEIPPAPTAAALGKYGEIPVSLYSGTPNINIPIFELTSHDLSVPISLSYHASGVKVTETASWVGMGWSLNAGGVITRTMRGRPDEVANGYAFQDPNGAGEGDTPLGFQQKIESMSIVQQTNFFHSITSGALDVEPDLFSFNFLGRTGKFVFDRQGKIHLIPMEKIRIVPQYEEDVNEVQQGAVRELIGFEVWDEAGVKYVFSAVESTRLAVSTCNILGIPNPKAYNSSWHLTEIHSPLGDDIIHFEYVSETIVYDVSLSETQINLPNGKREGATTRCSSRVTAEVKRLDKITTAQGYAEFDMAPREDLLGASRLETIKIFNNWEVAAIKEFNLEYVYSHNTNSECDLSGTGIGADERENFYRKRLFLRALTEGPDRCFDNTGYQFEYKSIHDLPPRYSCAQDYWGYYNGQTGNSTLIPQMDIRVTDANNLNDLNDTPIDLDGANRRPRGRDASLGTITKIVYPTGGYTTFEFEGNTAEPLNPPDKDFEELGGIRIDFYPNERRVGGSSIEERWKGIISVHAFGEEDGAYARTTRTYDQPTQARLRASFNVTDKDAFLSKLATKPRIEIQHESNSQPYVFTTDQLGHSTQEMDVVLHGTYTITAEVQYNLLNDEAILAIRTQEEVTNDSGTPIREMGGIRIKKIVNNDGTKEDRVQEFHYTANGASTGDFGHRPVFHYMTPIPGSNSPQIVRSSNANTYGEDFGGYRQVTVTESANGSTRYSFYSPKDISGVEYLFPSLYPFPSPRNVKWQTGMEKSRLYRNATGKAISSVTNYYGLDDVVLDIESLKVGSFGDADAFDPGYKHSIDNIKTGLTQLDSVVTTTFDPFNGLPLKSKTSYQYGEDHLQVTQIEETLNSGKRRLTTNQYPLDLTGQVDHANSLVAEHRHNLVLEQTISQGFEGDLKIVAGSKTKYADFNQNTPEGGSVGILPQEIKNLNLTRPVDGYEEQDFSVETRFLEYDSHGNPLRVEQRNGIITQLDWDSSYDQTLLTKRTLNPDKVGLIKQSLAFDYQPLVGLTKQTDPNSFSTDYDYDDFDRLQEVRDHEDNLVQYFEYQLPSVGCPLELTLSGPSRLLEGYSAPVHVTAHPFGGSGTYTYEWHEFDSEEVISTESALSLIPALGRNKYYCRVTDSEGKTAFTPHSIYVVDLYNTLVDATNQKPRVGEPVHITGMITAEGIGENPIQQAYLKIGDEEIDVTCEFQENCKPNEPTLTSITVERSFSQLGSVPVSFHIVDQEGNHSIGQGIKIEVQRNSPPIASFIYANDPIIWGTRAEFDATASSDPDEGDQITSCQWELQIIDLNPDDDVNPVPNQAPDDGIIRKSYSGCFIEPDIRFVGDTKYVMTLTVKDESQLANSIEKILDTTPRLTFRESQLRIHGPSDLELIPVADSNTFSVSDTYQVFIESGEITSRSWFVKGGGDDGIKPRLTNSDELTFEATVAGKYDITYEVTAEGNQEATATLQVDVTEPPNIRVIEPNNTSIWPFNSNQTIAWNHVGGSTVRIQLYRGSHFYKQLVSINDHLPITDLNWDWTIDSRSCDCAPRDDYRIKIISGIGANEIVGWSSFFEITGAVPTDPGDGEDPDDNGGGSGGNTTLTVNVEVINGTKAKAHVGGNCTESKVYKWWKKAPDVSGWTRITGSGSQVNIPQGATEIRCDVEACGITATDSDRVTF